MTALVHPGRSGARVAGRPGLASWTLLYHLSITTIAAGAIGRSEVVMAGAAAGVGAAYIGRDVFVRRHLTVMTAYALGAGLSFGLANMLGYLLDGTRYRDVFDDYLVPEHVVVAQMLACAGLLIPLLVFDRVRRTGFVRLVPRVGQPTPDGVLLVAAGALAAFAWFHRVHPLPVYSLGILSQLILIGPSVAVYVVRRRAVATGLRPLPAIVAPVLVVLTVTEVVYQALFNVLRIEMVWPILAYTIPTAARRRGGARVVLLACGLAFAILFQPLGAVRTTVFGFGRIEAIGGERSASERAEVGTGPLDSSLALAARLSTHNQLSQVVRVTEEKGFADGETLGYVVFALVPRAVWPSKPLVTPGQWFAREVGRGTETASGGFSNAINMTVPGELYVNFGWYAVVPGLALFGALFALLQVAAVERADPRNAVASAMALLVYTQAFFVGSNASAITNLVILLFAGWLIGSVQRVTVLDPSIGRGTRRG